jgi:hypothetical protein
MKNFMLLKPKALPPFQYMGIELVPNVLTACPREYAQKIPAFRPVFFYA